MLVLESLQLAKMVADLSELEAARNDRARALLQANKEAEAAAAAAATATASTPTTPADQPHPSLHTHGAPATSHLPPTSAAANGTSSPLDSYLGRFLTPALTRTSSSHGTGLNTPQTQTQGHTTDPDRTSSVAALHELRAKLRQYNDSTSLRQAREKVAALSAQRQAGEHAAPTSDATSMQQQPMPHHHAQYTFPRE